MPWFPGKQLDRHGAQNSLNCPESCDIHTKLKIDKCRKILILWVVFQDHVSVSLLSLIFNAHHLSIMRHLLLKRWSAPAAYSSPSISAYHGIVIRAVGVIRFPVIRGRITSGHSLVFPLRHAEIGECWLTWIDSALPCTCTKPSTVHHTAFWVLPWLHSRVWIKSNLFLRSLERARSFRFTGKPSEFRLVPLWRLNAALITLSRWRLWTPNKQRPVFMQILLVIKR